MSIFHAPAFQPQLRPALLETLRSDPSVRAKAQAELERLEAGKPLGLLERDHISRMVYDMLNAMLARIRADESMPQPIVKVVPVEAIAATSTEDK
jgi:hypothetical protein